MPRKNVFSDGSAVYVKNGSTEFQVLSSTGQLYHNGTAITAVTTDLNTVNEINANESGSTASNLTAYGLSLLSYSTADAKLYTLDAPVTGKRKILTLNTTAVPDSTAIDVSVYTGSTAIFIRDNSTAYTEKLYINMLPPFASVELIGLSTAEYGVLTTYGAVQFSTAGTYTT